MGSKGSVLKAGFVGLLTATLLAGCGTSPLVSSRMAVAGQASYTAAGGVQTENFAEVNPNLYRGGLPTEADLLALKKMGVKTDVCLMGAGPASQRQLVEQERKLAAKVGLNFVNIVVPYSLPSRAIQDRFLQTVTDPAAQPVYVHCQHGRDRTGSMVALYRIAEDGLTGQQALAEMQRFGFKTKDYPYYAKMVLEFGR